MNPPAIVDHIIGGLGVVGLVVAWFAMRKLRQLAITPIAHVRLVVETNRGRPTGIGSVVVTAPRIGSVAVGLPTPEARALANHLARITRSKLEVTE